MQIRSEVGYFIGHWKRGAVRCPGEEVCSICASGGGRRLFTYWFIEDEHGEVLAFEIPERLRDLAEELENAAGTNLMIRRDGLARNSRIEIQVVGFEICDKLDIWPFVRTLGTRVVDFVEHPTQSESLLPPGARTEVP